MAQCSTYKRDGTCCTLQVAGKNDVCWAHDPNNAEQPRKRSSKGGRSKASREIRDLKKQLEDLMGAFWRGASKGALQRSSTRSSTPGRLIELERKAREKEEFVGRVEALEQMRNPRGLRVELEDQIRRLKDPLRGPSEDEPESCCYDLALEEASERVHSIPLASEEVRRRFWSLSPEACAVVVFEHQRWLRSTPLSEAVLGDAVGVLFDTQAILVIECLKTFHRLQTFLLCYIGVAVEDGFDAAGML